MRRLLVVAAFLVQEGKVLLARRPEGKARGGFWEFPGGKVEEGETPEEALVRELNEELGLWVQVGPRLAAVDYDYPDVSIRLLCYRVYAQGLPTPLEGQGLCWCLPEEIDKLSLAPADQLIWEEISRYTKQLA